MIWGEELKIPLKKIKRALTNGLARCDEALLPICT
jgi:hypothetical protein